MSLSRLPAARRARRAGRAVFGRLCAASGRATSRDLRLPEFPESRNNNLESPGFKKSRNFKYRDYFQISRSFSGIHRDTGIPEFPKSRYVALLRGAQAWSMASSSTHTLPEPRHRKRSGGKAAWVWLCVCVCACACVCVCVCVRVCACVCMCVLLAFLFSYSFYFHVTFVRAFVCVRWREGKML